MSPAEEDPAGPSRSRAKSPNRPNYISWIGFLVYFLSFLLPTVRYGVTGSNSVLGIECAWVALEVPLSDFRNLVLRGSQPDFSPLESICLFISGLINPVFISALILGEFRRHNRLASRLRIAVVLMVPFSWFFFYLIHDRPLAGHYVWIAGILLTIFSDNIEMVRLSRPS
jgi:hypothetical protein